MTDYPSNRDSSSSLSCRRFQDSLKLLGEHRLPLEVGQIEVDDDGFLRAREHDLPLHFNFTFRGFDFDVLVTHGDDACVQLRSVLGNLPFTAESVTARQAIARLLSLAGSLSHGRLALSPRGEIIMQAETMPPAPRTPISIMASVAALLLEARPHLDLIAEVIHPLAPLRTRTG